MAGTVLDISRYLEGNPSPKNRIHRVGVELEGGWATLPPDTNLEHDGSVTVTSPPGTRLSVGELPSPPKLPIAMWPWMRKYYPSHINNTCGLHVHMSFGSARLYQLLMVEDFQTTMLHYLAEWGKAEGLPLTHPLWDRLNGKNRYCSLDFWPDSQVRHARKSYSSEQPGHRYTAINYCYGLNGCGTVECRVMPMYAEAEMAIRAVKRVLLITNACLVKLAKKESVLLEEIPMTRDSYIEESMELVR